ncbi:MAG: hypothetical protein M1820_007948 [Bogoriella megaspora]|nr:MAG: hypothetical protein M1820_007948 [Bogoriella megaspora]
MDFPKLQELANNYNYASLLAYEPHRYEQHIADLFVRDYSTKQIENHLRKHREAKQSRLWTWLEGTCKYLRERPDQSSADAIHCSFLDTFVRTKELDDFVKLISMIFHVPEPVSNEYSCGHIWDKEERELATWDTRLELLGTQISGYPFDEFGEGPTPGYETEDSGPTRKRGKAQTRRNNMRAAEERQEVIPPAAFQEGSVTEHSESENGDTDKPPVRTNPESSQTASSTEDAGSKSRDKLQELKNRMKNNKERRRDSPSDTKKVLESDAAATTQPETKPPPSSHVAETHGAGRQSHSHSVADTAQLSTTPSNTRRIWEPQYTASSHLEAEMSQSSHVADSSPQPSLSSATDTPQSSTTSFDTSKDLEQQASTSKQLEAVMSRSPHRPETPDTSPQSSSRSIAKSARSSTTPSSRRTRSSTKQSGTCCSSDATIPSNTQRRLLAAPKESSRLRRPTYLPATVREDAYEDYGTMRSKKRVRDAIETVCEDDADFERNFNAKRQRKSLFLQNAPVPESITRVLVHSTDGIVETGNSLDTAGTDEELLPDASYVIDGIVGNALTPPSIAPTSCPPLSSSRRRELRTRRFIF